MEWLIGALSSSGFGVVAGLVGNFVSKKMEIKKEELEKEFLIAKGELEIRSMEAEQSHEIAMADKQVERARAEGEIKIEHAEIGAFTENQKTLGKLEGALRWVRPLITGYLLVVSSYLFYIVWQKVDGLENFSAI